MYIRQIALVAGKLDPIVPDVCSVLGIEVGFNDPGVGEFGLENAVMPIGTQFLEVVAPIKPNTTAGRYLERRKGDGGYMVILQVPDIDAAKQRCTAHGVRLVWEANYHDVRSFHMHPRDIGGAIVSLDQPKPAESWRWGGPDWKKHVRTGVTTEIVGVDIQCEDPSAMADRWSEVMGQAIADGTNGTPRLALERGHFVQFVPDKDGRGDGVSAVYVRAADAGKLKAAAKQRGFKVNGESVEMGGVRFVAV